ncbi:MAG: hypothetical protein ABFD96_06145 [Armatimonadia bacterium]
MKNQPRHLGPRKATDEAPPPPTPGDRQLIEMHTAAVLDLDCRKFSAMKIAAKLRVPYRIVRAILAKHRQ